MENEDNTLVDGTLIDLCGATLLWRSAEGKFSFDFSDFHTFTQTKLMSQLDEKIALNSE